MTWADDVRWSDLSRESSSLQESEASPGYDRGDALEFLLARGVRVVVDLVDLWWRENANWQRS